MVASTDLFTEIISETVLTGFVECKYGGRRQEILMKLEIRYELWKNDVIQASRELVAAGKGVGLNGLMALAAYHDAQRRLWDVIEREPKS